jgi:hypothetical protein
VTGSNRRPSRCKRDALPTELTALFPTYSKPLRIFSLVSFGRTHSFTYSFLSMTRLDCISADGWSIPLLRQLAVPVALAPDANSSATV